MALPDKPGRAAEVLVHRPNGLPAHVFEDDVASWAEKGPVARQVGCDHSGVVVSVDVHEVDRAGAEDTGCIVRPPADDTGDVPEALLLDQRQHTPVQPLPVLCVRPLDQAGTQGVRVGLDPRLDRVGVDPDRSPGPIHRKAAASGRSERPRYTPMSTANRTPSLTTRSAITAALCSLHPLPKSTVTRLSNRRISDESCGGS